MTLLNYTKTTSVAGAKGVLDDIRTFAAAQSWIEDDYQSSIVWNSISGWVAGNDTFMQLRSVGYGSQNIAVRFYADDSSGILHIKLVDPNNTTVIVSATHPMNQNSAVPSIYFNTALARSGIDMPSSNIPAVYCIGNSRFIALYVQVESDKVFSYAFGIPDLLDYWISSKVSFLWTNYTRFYEGGSLAYDDDLTDLDDEVIDFSDYAPGSGYDQGYLESVAFDLATDNQYKIGFRWTSADDDIELPTSVWGKPLYTFYEAPHSGLRFMKKQPVYFSASGVWYLMGYMPFWRINGYGITPGTELDYGGQTYLTFPTLSSAYNPGTAFRVA